MQIFEKIKKYVIKDKYSFSIGLAQIFIAVISYVHSSNLLLMFVLLVIGGTFLFSGITKRTK